MLIERKKVADVILFYIDVMHYKAYSKCLEHFVVQHKMILIIIVMMLSTEKEKETTKSNCSVLEHGYENHAQRIKDEIWPLIKF